MAAREYRRDFIVPIIMLVGGWIVSVLYTATSLEAGLVGALAESGVWVIVLGVSVIAGLIGLIVVCKLYGEDAGSLWLGLVRLAGVCSATMAAALLFTPVVGCLRIILTLGIMAGLVALVFRMDLRAGMVVATVTWLAWFGANLGVTWMTTG
ncbi:MAG: hypothetical protein JSV91_10185 [Phycisphaerales bacterium]|nr:MAG: hypothetical protein JSV91_10185 [Phycisphaerales bacterium]